MSETSGRVTLQAPPEQVPRSRARRAGVRSPAASSASSAALSGAPSVTGAPRLAPGAEPRARPAASPGPRPGARPTPRRVSTAPRTGAGNRMPFFILVCGLLSGALVSALVISTTLAAGSFQITNLQQSDTALAKQRQQLEAEVSAAQSAQVIEQRASELGMRPLSELQFLNLKSGKVQTEAGTGAAGTPGAPGYVP